MGPPPALDRFGLFPVDYQACAQIRQTHQNTQRSRGKRVPLSAKKAISLMVRIRRTISAWSNPFCVARACAIRLPSQYPRCRMWPFPATPCHDRRRDAPLHRRNTTSHSRRATPKLAGLHTNGHHRKVVRCGGGNGEQPRPFCKHATSEGGTLQNRGTLEENPSPGDP